MSLLFKWNRAKFKTFKSIFAVQGRFRLLTVFDMYYKLKTLDFTRYRETDLKLCSSYFPWLPKYQNCLKNLWSESYCFLQGFVQVLSFAMKVQNCLKNLEQVYKLQPSSQVKTRLKFFYLPTKYQSSTPKLLLNLCLFCKQLTLTLFVIGKR